MPAVGFSHEEPNQLAVSIKKMRVAGGLVVRRRGSRASGGMSGWRPRKVELVDRAGRGGAVDVGDPASCRVGDEAAFDVGHWHVYAFGRRSCGVHVVHFCRRVP